MDTLAALHEDLLKAACAFCFKISSVMKKRVNCAPSSRRVRPAAAAGHVLAPDLQNSTLGSNSFRHHAVMMTNFRAYELPASEVSVLVPS